MHPVLIGLLMLGQSDSPLAQTIIPDLLNYTHDTSHEKIVRYVPAGNMIKTRTYTSSSRHIQIHPYIHADRQTDRQTDNLPVYSRIYLTFYSNF